MINPEEKLNKKNQKIFIKIFNEYFTDLNLFLREYSENPNLVDDIIQETFFEVYNRFDELKSHPKYKDYIFAIAIRHSKRLNHKYYKEVLGTAPLEMREDDGVELIAENLEIVKQILSKKEFKIIELIYIDGYKAKEVAKVVGVSERALYKRLFKIKEKIRIKFKRNNIII